MKKLLALLLLSPFVAGEELNLICEGLATEKTSKTITTKSKNPYDLSQKAESRTRIKGENIFDASIFLNLSLEKLSGTLEVPKSLRRKNAKLTKTDLTELIVSENFFEGKAQWNGLAKVKFTLDRRTGILDYKTTGNISFNGNCSKFENTKKF
jgi:hypothetical protein